MPPTLQDIAEAAGVGKSTVSLALRNDPRLRPATRERIQKVAEEMGYRRNAAVSLAMAQIRSHDRESYQANLGVINVSSFQNALELTPTFREWMRGCHERGKELGYGLDKLWLFEPGMSEEKLIGVMTSRNILGLLVSGILERRRMPKEFHAIAERFPTVAIGVRPSEPRMHCCLNDQFSTAVLAVKEAVALGYKKPGFVMSPRVDRLVDFRFSGGFYVGTREVLGKAEAKMQFGLNETDKEGFLKWFSKAEPDVILTLHDEVFGWLSEEGVRVPEEVGLVHLDLSSEHEAWAGMLQNSERVGAGALDILIGQIHRCETGLPAVPRSALVESTWRDGRTVRRKATPEADT